MMCKVQGFSYVSAKIVYVSCLFLFLMFQANSAFAQCGAAPAPSGFDCAGWMSSYSGGSDCVSEEYINSISGTESGGQYQCVNSIGANGRYQFMDGTRADICSRTSLPCVSAGDFAHCPALQDAYFQEFNRLNYQQLQACGALDRVGQTINGVVVTESGLLAAAHLGGAGGACNWANSGGTYDPDDGHTSLTDYARTHGGLPAMGSDCPASTTPPTTPPVSPSCSGGGSPMCTVTNVGSPTDTGSSFLPPFIPPITDYSRCLDRCDNHPDSTSLQAYYYNCSFPSGSSYSGFSGCCCPGEVLFGGINPGRECACCGGIC